MNKVNWVDIPDQNKLNIVRALLIKGADGRPKVRIPYRDTPDEYIELDLPVKLGSVTIG